MSDYKKQIAGIKASIDSFASEVLAQTTMETLRQVTQYTPVKTGRAKSNWLVGVDAPERKEVDDTTEQNIAQGQAAVEGVKGDSTVYISNNLPYIERLNDGHSTQAPAGFVEEAAITAQLKIEEIASRGMPK